LGDALCCGAPPRTSRVAFSWGQYQLSACPPQHLRGHAVRLSHPHPLAERAAAYSYVPGLLFAVVIISFTTSWASSSRYSGSEHEGIHSFVPSRRQLEGSAGNCPTIPCAAAINSALTVVPLSHAFAFIAPRRSSGNPSIDSLVMPTPPISLAALPASRSRTIASLRRGSTRRNMRALASSFPSARDSLSDAYRTRASKAFTSLATWHSPAPSLKPFSYSPGSQCIYHDAPELYPSSIVYLTTYNDTASAI
jgi:hypothetical protein